MAKQFTYSLQTEAKAMKEIAVTGQDIHNTWNVFHKNPDDRGLWIVDPSTGYLRITSNQNGISGRYDPAMLTATNYTFFTEVIPAIGDDDSFGIHFRYTDNFHFYFVSWDGGGEYNWKPNTLRLYKAEGNDFKLLAQTSAKGNWVGGQKYTFEIEAVGTNFVVRIDGVEALRATDTDNPYLAGAYGPIATSQLCTWTRFAQRQEQSFTLSKDVAAEVTIDSYDYATGKTLTGPIYDLVKPDIDTYLAANSFVTNSEHVDRYVIATAEPAVDIYFAGGTPSKVTTDGASLVKAYMRYDENPPQAPAGFFGTPGLTDIRWSWTDVARFEDGFEILNELDEVIAVTSKDVATWLEEGLEQDTTYTRKVRAYNAFGKSASVQATARTESSAQLISPNTPENVRGITNGVNQITWYWNSSNRANEYRVYDENGNQLYVTNGNKFIETGLAEDTMYRRYVVAYNIAGASSPSGFAVAFTDSAATPTGPVPAAPLNMAGSVISKNVITWTWEAGDVQDVQYRVYDLNGEILYETPVGILEFLEDNLEEATSYARYVKAFNENGESTRSNYAYATTMSEPIPGDISEPEAPWDPDAIYFKPSEQEPAERIEAFHSGIGDQLDLKVRISRGGTMRERFSYDIQLKGYEYTTVQAFTRQSFKFRFKAEGTESTVSGPQPWVNYSIWYDGAVNGIEPFTESNAFGKKPLVAPIEVPAPSNVTIQTWYVELDDVSGAVEYIIQNGVGNATTRPNDAVIFSSVIQEPRDVRQVWYGPKVRGETVYEVIENVTLSIKDKFLSPYKDPLLKDKSISEWKLIVTSRNPNVDVRALLYETNWPPDAMFIDLNLEARLINPTQAAWNPLVHNGYYYFNQKEHFLYADSKVKGEYRVTEGAQLVEFPYAIKVLCERTINASTNTWKFTNRADYIGTLNLIDLDTQPGNVILAQSGNQYVDSGDMTSSEIELSKGLVEAFDEIKWTAAEPHGSKVTVETSTYDGATWSPWQLEANGQSIKSPLSNRIKYRLVLTSGTENVKTLFEQAQDTDADFNAGTFVNAKSQNGEVQIANTELGQSSWLSPLLDIGHNIDSLGKVTYLPTMTGYSGEAIEIFTVTSGDPTGPWDGTGEPLMPLSLLTQNPDGTISGTVASAKHRYLRYQARLTRGRQDTTYTTTLGNLANTSEYISAPLNMGHVTSFKDIILDVTYPARDGSVDVFTQSSETSDGFGSTWQPIGSNGSIQSPRAKYLKVKTVSNPGKSATGTKTITHTSSADFGLGQTNNIVILAAGQFRLSDPHLPGEFISGPMDFANVDYWTRITDATSLNGGSLTVSTSTADTDTGPWEAWASIGTNGEISSSLKRFIRYRVQLTAGVTEAVSVYSDDLSSKWQTGVATNGTYSGTVLSNTDARLPMVYESAAKELVDIKDGMKFAYYKALAQDAVVTAESQTSVDGVTWSPWVAIPEDGTIASPARRYIKYRLSVTAGYGAATKKSLIDNTQALFNEPTPTLDNTKVAAGSNSVMAVQLSDTGAPGNFYSGIYDFDGRVSAWGTILIGVRMPGTGGTLRVYTASSDDAADLADAFASDWQEAIFDAGLGRYTIESPPGRYLRYRIAMTPGTTGGQPASPELNSIEIPTTNTGFEPFAKSTIGNTSVTFNQYQYASPVVGSVSVDAGVYTIVYPRVNTIMASANVYYWHSPAVAKISVRANTFMLVKHTPVLEELSFGVKLPQQVVDEEHAVSMLGKVPADMLRHIVSEGTMKSIIDDYMTSMGINQNGLVRLYYELISGVPDIALDVRDGAAIHYQTGESQVYAVTNSSITESVASQAKVYVNDDGEALVTPIPMQGAPVIIRDLSGREMTQVFFDDSGTPTLDAEEDFETDGSNEIALMDTDIDESTLEVWVDENRTSSYTKVEEYALRNNIIYLRKTYPELTPVKVLYRVNRSFSVDYNFNPAEGYAMIKLHNPVLDDSREINVWFETNANSAYYLSSELNLNPMNNLLSEGFIYLTDSVEPAKKLDIRFNPNTLLGNGYDRTTILVIARDQFGNAVVGDTINFVVDHGEITVIQAVTDENGLASAIYTAPVWTGVAELQVIDATSRIESKASIIIKSPASAPRITLTADKLAIDADNSDTVKITARVMNGLQQPAAEAIVNFDTPEATVLNPVSTTNYIGEAYSYIQAAAVPPDGIITLKVRVSSLGITEYINIRVNE